MSDFRVAVRRTNEWDGPSMLKIYTPYVEKTHYTPDTEVPTLAEYVQRIDTYTYGRMWILTEINNQTAGFCFLTDRDIPKDDLFSADAQLYVSEKCLHSGVGGAPTVFIQPDAGHHAPCKLPPRYSAHQSAERCRRGIPQKDGFSRGLRNGRCSFNGARH